VIPKGGFERVHQAGLASFREEIVRLAPYLRDRVDELGGWSDIKLLTVAVDRLRDWHRPGLLCIGDAAHAMSPIGGVGINLAIQDAVAAANILAPRFLRGEISDDDLQAVQRRREFPTRAMQAVQIFMQNRVIGRVLESKEKLSPPLPLRLLARWPLLQRLPARLIGLGFRPEHVRMSAGT
jgi:2-polyprenyl-6-methoxyphenol hydroxylase-like FAD-dependent oxidoreductase